MPPKDSRELPIDRAREPRIEHYQTSLGSHEDVRWLQIAVDDSSCVKRANGIDQRAHQAAQALLSELRVGRLDDARDGFAAHELHGEETFVAVDVELEQLDDAGMIEVLEVPELAAESLIRVIPEAAEHLERHHVTTNRVVREIHVAEPTMSERSDVRITRLPPWRHEWRRGRRETARGGHWVDGERRVLWVWSGARWREIASQSNASRARLATAARQFSDASGDIGIVAFLRVDDEPLST